MDEARRQLGQFRAPRADIFTYRVELLALQHRVEDAEIGRGIGATARNPLPGSAIGREVRIHQRIPEPGLTFLPGLQQMFHEKRSRDHAHAVMHPARLPKLAHPGIHNRIASLPALPGAKHPGIRRPGKGREIGAQRRLRHFRAVPEQMMRKLPPQHFLEEGLQPCAALRGRRPRRHPDLTRRNLPEMQMGRKP